MRQLIEELRAQQLGSTKLLPYWNVVKDRYKLKRYIGRGTYGEVVQAKDRESKEEVAIKHIKVEKSAKGY